MDNRYKRLGTNTILVFIGKFGSGIITFFMLPFYTRWLSPESYGSAELINTYSNILYSIATCCMADAIFIFPKNSDRLGKSKYFSSGFTIALIGFSFVFLCAILLSHKRFTCLGTFHSRSMQIAVLSVSLFLQNYSQQFTRSIDKMKVYSICGIIQTILVAIFAFLLVPQFNINGYIYSLVLANIFAAIYTVYASGSFRFLSIKCIDKEYSKDLIKYGILLIPNSMMWWLIDGINKPIMEKKIGLTAIGVYAVASKFPSVLNVVTGAFSNAWGISVSEEYGNKDFNTYFNKIFKFLFFILMLLSLLISMSADLLISLFTSSTYSHASVLLPILLLSVIFSNAGGLFGGIFMAKKKSKYFFYSSFWGALFSLCSIFVFVRFWGVMGVAWSSVLSFFIIAVSRAYFVWKDINQMDCIYYIKSLCLYLIMFIAIVSFDGISRCFIAFFILLLFLYMNKSILMNLYKMCLNNFLHK